MKQRSICFSGHLDGSIKRCLLGIQRFVHEFVIKNGRVACRIQNQSSKKNPLFHVPLLSYLGVPFQHSKSAFHVNAWCFPWIQLSKTNRQIRKHLSQLGRLGSMNLGLSLRSVRAPCAPCAPCALLDLQEGSLQHFCIVFITDIFLQIFFQICLQFLQFLQHGLAKLPLARGQSFASGATSSLKCFEVKALSKALGIEKTICFPLLKRFVFLLKNYDSFAPGLVHGRWARCDFVATFENGNEVTSLQSLFAKPIASLPIPLSLCPDSLANSTLEFTLYHCFPLHCGLVHFVSSLTAIPSEKPEKPPPCL